MMRRIAIQYAIWLFLALAGFKALEYAFFSHRMTLDVYLGITALIFLLLGAGLARYLWSKGVTTSQARCEDTDPQIISKFSMRERDILRLLAEGYTNKEIAESLLLSPNTIKTHLKNLFVKLGVSNRTQAAAEAKSLNLL